MSVLDLNPKVSEETKTPVASFGKLEEVDKRECATPFASSGETASLTQTEKAKQAFLEGVSQIPGAFACTYGGQTLAEQAIRVVVPDILGATADTVYALEVQIRRLYRNVRLNVEIEEADSDDKPASQLSANPE